jgi:hypothetical protein
MVMVMVLLLLVMKERLRNEADQDQSVVTATACRFISPFGPMRAKKRTVHTNGHGCIVIVGERLVGIAGWHGKGKKVLRLALCSYQ